MVSDNSQRPIRSSALALGRLSTPAPSLPRRRGRWLALITTLSISALAIAVASPTPALTASEASQPSKPTVVKPIPIGPGTPQVFKGDVRDLPKAKRWKPGDPIIVAPGPGVHKRPPGEGIPPQLELPKLDPLLEGQESALKSEETRASSPPDRGGSYGCQ